MVEIFKRNKKNGQRKIIGNVPTIQEAREFCKRENKATDQYWFEFTENEVTT